MTSVLETTKADQEAAIQFTRQLLHDWMRQNTIEGMNLQQSLWMFSRFEGVTISTPWNTAQSIDLFKMLYVGAVPTVYYCLLRVQPDDMTQPYHWLTQARIDWFKSRIEEYIGADTAAYIGSLP